MADYFRDFIQPAKTIFDRLQQQSNKRIIINGKDGSHNGANVVPPFYPDLPEYPCRLIRGVDGKVTEIQYGDSPHGYVWKQNIVRRADGKVDKIVQENPDGTLEIVLNRDSKDKVEVIDVV